MLVLLEIVLRICLIESCQWEVLNHLRIMQLWENSSPEIELVSDFATSPSSCLDPPESQHFFPGLGHPWPWLISSSSMQQRPKRMYLSSVWQLLLDSFARLFWIWLFLHVECPKICKLDPGRDPLGQKWGNTATVNCNKQFGDQIVLQVSSEAHRGFVFLEMVRLGLLLSTRWLPSPSVAPWYHLSDSLWDISF